MSTDPEAMPGSVVPERSVATNVVADARPGLLAVLRGPGDLVDMRALRARGGGLRRAIRNLPLPSGFPWTAPTWPTTVAKPPQRSSLGVRYDTDWARRYPVRLARAAFTEGVARPALLALGRPVIGGADRVEHVHGPVIFAANHVSHLDTPLVLSFLPDRWRHRTVPLGAADYFFDTKTKAVLTAFFLNAVPIERVKISRDAAHRAAALVDEGWNLLIFPEGGRSPDGWAQEHRAGAAWLAERTGRPIVPIHVQGTGRLLPRGSRRLHPGTTRLTFGRPIEPGAGARPLARQVDDAIAALADETATDWWSARRRAAAGATPSLRGPATESWRRTWALGSEGRRARSTPGTDASSRSARAKPWIGR